MGAGAELMTADELLRLPAEGWRYELVQGVLHQLPLRTEEHGAIAANILIALGVYVHAHKLGYVYTAGTGFLLGTNPDTVLAPSCGFVCRARVEATGGLLHSYRPGAPDLTVEVISRDARYLDVTERVEDWLEAGARLVWVVDPRGQRIKVHQPDQPPVKLTIADQLDGGDVIPGWTLPVQDVFS